MLIPEKLITRINNLTAKLVHRATLPSISFGSVFKFYFTANCSPIPSKISRNTRTMIQLSLPIKKEHYRGFSFDSRNLAINIYTFVNSLGNMRNPNPQRRTWIRFSICLSASCQRFCRDHYQDHWIWKFRRRDVCAVASEENGPLPWNATRRLARRETLFLRQARQRARALFPGHILLPSSHVSPGALVSTERRHERQTCNKDRTCPPDAENKRIRGKMGEAAAGDEETKVKERRKIWSPEINDIFLIKFQTSFLLVFVTS